MATTTNDVVSDEPVAFFDEYIEPPQETPEWETPEEMMAYHQSLRESALKKLKNFGLTEEEAKTVIGF